MAELRTILLSEIDEPPLPMRSTMDDGKLRELADSIAQIGLQQPITVVEREQWGCLAPGADAAIRDGEAPPILNHYYIVTGHRRFIAHQMLGKADISAIVRKPGEVQEIAAMIAENLCREDVNPAEEAVWLAELVELHGYTEEKLMQATRRSADYIGDRFRLLRGDEKVLDALRTNAITLSVARELNKLEDESMRRYYLDAAIRGGATTRVVRQWIDDYRLRQMPAQPVQESVQPAAVEQGPVTPYVPECAACGGRKDPWNLINVTIHKWEWEQLQRAMRESALAGSD